MNRVVLLLFTFIFSTALFSYAQSLIPPTPPVNEYYSEVFTVADCLNAYEGTTCIITGTISYGDSTYHHYNTFFTIFYICCLSLRFI